MVRRLESIELYKPYDAAKVTGVGIVSRKLDGVPVRIRKMGGHRLAHSRQHELITSIPHILPYAGELISDGGSLVGELYIEGMPFKDINGLVRTVVPTLETGKLVYYLHDFDVQGKPELPYRERMKEALIRLVALRARLGVAVDDLPIRVIPGVVCRDAGEVQAAFDAIMQSNPNAEGAMWHDIDKDFIPGKRRWSGMKIKPRPTIDVWVVGFEEAVSKFGSPKDMVGGVLIELHTMQAGKLTVTQSAVGPGALKHAERKHLWALFKQGKFSRRLAEVKYMQDDTYEGLREGTFVRWRDDKSEHDVRHK